MSFNRVNSSGWASGDVLTSAQANALDVDHANALDKTSAGDTLSGVVTTSGAGSIHAATSGGVQATVAGGITSAGTANGGIALIGGANDWITFGVGGASPRTRQIVSPADTMIFVSDAVMSQGGGFAVNFTATSTNAPKIPASTGGMMTTVVNTANANVWGYYLPLRQLHNGATLTSAALWLAGSSSQSSLPQTMPAFGIYRMPILAATGFVSLNSSPGYAVDGSASVSAFKTAHSIAFTANQDNVIDTTQYAYAAVIWDQGGTNAVAGDTFLGIVLTYGSITSMQFQ